MRSNLWKKKKKVAARKARYENDEIIRMNYQRSVFLSRKETCHWLLKKVNLKHINYGLIILLIRRWNSFVVIFDSNLKIESGNYFEKFNRINLHRYCISFEIITSLSNRFICTTRKQLFYSLFLSLSRTIYSSVWFSNSTLEAWTNTQMPRSSTYKFH